MAIRIPNKNPLDLTMRKAIGVSIPFNAPAVFNSTYSTTDQIKSNIINDILLKYINNYGWLDDNDILELKNLIKSKTFSFTFKELISKWPESNIKYYSLQTFLTRTPKLKEKFTQTNNIINIKNILDELNYKKLLDIIIN